MAAGVTTVEVHTAEPSERFTAWLHTQATSWMFWRREEMCTNSFVLKGVSHSTTSSAGQLV